MQIDRVKFEAARARIDRTKAWVAKRAGTSKQALQNYVEGRPLPPELYPRLAAALGTADFLHVAPLGAEPPHMKRREARRGTRAEPVRLRQRSTAS